MLNSVEERLRQARLALPGPGAAARRRSAERLLSELDATRLPRGRITRRGTAIAALAAACVAVGFFVGAATTTGSSNAATFSALGFEPSAGWNVVSTGAISLRAGQAAVATNEHFRKEDAPAGTFPLATIGHLRSNGIVIWVFALPHGQNRRVDTAFMPRNLPLRLDDARILGAWETQPNPRVPEYRIWAAIGNVNVDARIYFGTQTPSARLREIAQRELSRLVVPRS
jgi:hypothetical protein